jgi:hypothetical protein
MLRVRWPSSSSRFAVPLFGLGVLGRDVDADAGALVAGVGQAGQAAAGGAVEGEQGAGGGGEVVDGAGLGGPGPQREHVGRITAQMH